MYLVYVKIKMVIVVNLINGNIFFNNKFEKTDISIKNGKINYIEKISDNENCIDCTDKYIIPGLVDIHTHGCVGYDFSSANENDIKLMQQYYLSNGITSIMPTTVALSDENIVRATNKIKNVINKSVSGAKIRGINLEGPYLSEKKCGAHDSTLLKEPDIDFINSLGEDIKVVHVAPEYTKAFDFIKNFKGKTSIAHTACDYKTAIEAINHGADHITHIFNAMNGIHHREPGVIGAFFDSQAIAEMICDGIHINDALLRMMFNCYSERIAIISDSMAATGLTDGEFKLGNLNVHVKSGIATLEDGTLAGSAMNLMQMLKHLISIGVKPESAIRSATIIPAKSVNIDDTCGIIDTGRNADIVILDKDFNTEKIIFNGEFIS